MKQLLAIIVLGSLVACGGNDYPAQDKSIMPANGEGTSAPTTTDVMPANTDRANADVQTINSTQPTQAAPAVTLAGMNPAHGEPNHRCDIAVGAPLSSPVSNTATNPTVQTVTAPTVQTVTAPAVPAPAQVNYGTAKLNPAHGEPGHDCAKPVGAPLN